MILGLLLVFANAYEYESVFMKGLSFRPKACVFVHGHRGHFSQGLKIQAELKEFCDVYSLDFKEDISGISHQVVYKQAQFIKLEIERLYLQYNEKVVVISHSMGGVSALLSAVAVYDKIEIVITLNSPLESSPVNSYLAFPYIYYSIHEFLKTTTMDYLSITGGSDIMVAPILTKPWEIHQKYYSTQIF